jgi:hypothetical protein
MKEIERMKGEDIFSMGVVFFNIISSGKQLLFNGIN